MPSPVACTLSSLNAVVNNYASSSADTTTITIYQNQGATALSCPVSTNGNKSSCTDTTHTLTVNKGDLIAIGFVESNANPFNAVTVQVTCQ